MKQFYWMFLFFKYDNKLNGRYPLLFIYYLLLCEYINIIRIYTKVPNCLPTRYNVSQLHSQHFVLFSPKIINGNKIVKLLDKSVF